MPPLKHRPMWLARCIINELSDLQVLMLHGSGKKEVWLIARSSVVTHGA